MRRPPRYIRRRGGRETLFERLRGILKGVALSHGSYLRLPHRSPVLSVLGEDRTCMLKPFSKGRRFAVHFSAAQIAKSPSLVKAVFFVIEHSAGEFAFKSA